MSSDAVAKREPNAMQVAASKIDGKMEASIRRIDLFQYLLTTGIIVVGLFAVAFVVTGLYCAVQTIVALGSISGKDSAQIMSAAGPGVLLTTVLTLGTNLTLRFIPMMLRIFENTAHRKAVLRQVQFYLEITLATEEPLSFKAIESILNEYGRVPKSMVDDMQVSLGSGNQDSSSSKTDATKDAAN